MQTNFTEAHQPSCDRCWVREHSVFCGLDDDRLRAIETRKITRTFHRGEPLYLEGDVATGVFCLYRGAVKVFRTARDGREQIIRLATAGDLIGYRGIFDGEAHSTCATALDEVVACFIPRAHFAIVCENNPQLAHTMLGLLSHELVAVEGRMLELSQKSVRERLAETLMQMQEIFGFERDGSTLDVRLSRGELAELVGAATESVIRVLTDLKRAGVLSLRGKRIGILKPDALRDVANAEVVASRRASSTPAALS
jgi:CRP/FNR family transcriptional regulator